MKRSKETNISVLVVKLKLEVEDVNHFVAIILI